MIQDNPERRLKGLQLLCWPLFSIQLFDESYLAIKMPVTSSPDSENILFDDAVWMSHLMMHFAESLW